jgi:signal transduction histidine kinase
MVSLVLVAIVGNAVHAGHRMRLLQAEHEAATRQAIELERARIAGELHDVVTHNVSVMIVQAGAARQVMADAPDQARAALLAVESSGRAAMTELRTMLGLLSPVGAAAEPGAAGGESGAGGPQGDRELWPQPGLGQLGPLIDRVAAAGLPVELQVGDVPGLPPGLDLAAFRVVQEALTNVIKHAGKPSTSVSVDCRQGDLVVEVANAGRPIPAAAPGPATAPGSGRGLLGLRERTALYGGSLEAGPRPGGGWLVRARMPVTQLAPGPPGSRPPGSGAPGSGPPGSAPPGSGAPDAGEPGGAPTTGAAAPLTAIRR